MGDDQGFEASQTKRIKAMNPKMISGKVTAKPICIH
jgi:hypothetical protein